MFHSLYWSIIYLFFKGLLLFSLFFFCCVWISVKYLTELVIWVYLIFLFYLCHVVRVRLISVIVIFPLIWFHSCPRFSVSMSVCVFFFVFFSLGIGTQTFIWVLFLKSQSSWSINWSNGRIKWHIGWTKGLNIVIWFQQPSSALVSVSCYSQLFSSYFSMLSHSLKYILCFFLKLITAWL